MAALAVYVETSVWSFAFADDVPDYRADTLLFFERCRSGMVTPCVSPAVLDEIEQARPPIRERLADLIRNIGPPVLEITSDAERLAAAFIRERIVPANKPEDACHVAVAFDHEFDVLVSWNFRHIASVRRVDRFNAGAILEGYFKPLRIVSPAEVIYDDETDPA